MANVQVFRRQVERICHSNTNQLPASALHGRKTTSVLEATHSTVAPHASAACENVEKNIHGGKPKPRQSKSFVLNRNGERAYFSMMTLTLSPSLAI